MAGEPQRAEVLGWMQRTSMGPYDAARHFFPGVAPEQHTKIAEKFKKWRQRYSGTNATPQGRQAPASTAPSGPAPAVARPAPRHDLAKMSTVERLEWQLAELGADLDQARSVGDIRAAAATDRRISEVGQDLDRARAAEARTVKVDRTAAAIAAELEKKKRAIALHAENERRRLERAAKAAAASAARERNL